jgi:hypothetical protein
MGSSRGRFRKFKGVRRYTLNCERPDVIPVFLGYVGCVPVKYDMVRQDVSMLKNSISEISPQTQNKQANQDIGGMRGTVKQI